ncbi:MAG: aspartate carbamoyltransferase, partial [Candidatus Heimdallarchaeota archaeon]|nr:aspartate carbamoyltransferase [Candidatus Heimdallarchaeota archaeon]
MQHILCADQFDLNSLKKLFVRAKEMEEILEKGGSEIARGKILATLFYEPSTRTRLSFESAMLRLGGNIISETDVHFSSIIKGEVLPDTTRIISGYSDIIAIRSKNTGDADIAANFSSVPVINAGDGSGEHPTQSLLDCYTIFKQFPKIFDGESITLSFVGDLKYGRTVHSLCTMIRNFPNINIQFVAPKEMQIPKKYIEGSDKILTELTSEVLQKSDVIYNTRIQKERFEDKSEY